MNPYTGLLSVLLPPAEQTLLLQAALLPGGKGLEALFSWQNTISDFGIYFKGEDRGIKRILPMVYENLRPVAEDIPPALRTILRTAHLREELRANTIRLQITPVLEALIEEKIDFQVLKGLALACNVYPSYTLRHIHDIDLYVPQASHAKLIRVLDRFDGELSWETKPGDPVSYTLPSGLPILLHGSYFCYPAYHFPEPPVEQKRNLIIFDNSVSVLPPELMLVHLLGHAAVSQSRRTAQYVIDAVLLLGKYALNWEIVLQTIEDTNTILPASVQLEYLQRSFTVGIPAYVFEKLGKDAPEMPARYVEAAIDGARRGKTTPLGKLLECADNDLSRKALLKWMLAPSPELFIWQGRISEKKQAIPYMLRRPFHFLGRLLR